MLENILSSIVILHIFMIVVIGVLIWIALRLNHRVFRRIQEKQGGLHLLFLERVNSSIILIGGIILIFSVLGGIDSIWKTLLGGTAIISAILVFAAQDVVKDILAGLMIILYKPFEVGNRIELEDGTTGVVKDITMRHVVLRIIDTQMLIIPNSKLNVMHIRNYSYHAITNSAMFHFHIAYGSNVDKALEVVRQAVMASEYSIPGKQTENGNDYGQVYFLAYEDSSLRLDTTVYYEATTPSEVLISDINLHVYKALQENGIEIPFAYINVIQKGVSGDGSH